MTVRMRRAFALAVMTAWLSACQHTPARPLPSMLTLLTRDGCAVSTAFRSHLDEALRALHQPTTYAVIDLDSLPNSDPRTGYPTPTLLYGTRDLFGLPEPTPPLPDPT
jgi:hypothetical protein